MSLEMLIELGAENPEIFQAGWICGLAFICAFMLYSSICDVIIAIVRCIHEKTRAIKIENDKQDPPKKLFGKLFKKNEREEKEKNG